MAIAHFPYTLLIAVVALIPWFILFFGMLIPATFFDLFFGFSISGWINAKIFIKIFKVLYRMRKNMEKYVDYLLQNGAVAAKIIKAATVETAAWTVYPSW